MVATDTGLTLNARHGAQYECDGFTADVREDVPDTVSLRFPFERFPRTPADGAITLTKREARALLAVLNGALFWHADQFKDAQ